MSADGNALWAWQSLTDDGWSIIAGEVLSGSDFGLGIFIGASRRVVLCHRDIRLLRKYRYLAEAHRDAYGHQIRLARFAMVHVEESME